MSILTSAIFDEMMQVNQNPVERYAKEEFPVDSITNLAKAVGVSYGAIHKTIQGLYNSIPSSIVTYLAANSEYGKAWWQERYSEWIEGELSVLKSDIERGAIDATALFIPAKSLAGYYGSFKAWRESLSYSQIDFCKTFLLHQTIIHNYESGKMVSLPRSLKERLRFLGVTDEYIKELGKLSV